MRISDWSSDVCSSDLRWDSKTTKDQMTGETQIYVSSPTTRPVRGLGFPYQDVRAWLAVGCNASREWAYVGFTEAPNLTDTEAKSGGYSTFAARIKWGDKLEIVNMTSAGASAFSTSVMTTAPRSEERRVGKASGSTCKIWWAPSH